MKAYNDWMLDEWCAPSNGRLIPLIIVQLWDPVLAAAEIRRNAAKGCHAVTFSEIPPFLGLPSVHDKNGFWDPFLAACEETNTVVCMHIGSSSKMPSTSADAPPAVGSTLTYMNAAMSLTDWLMSGIFERFPNLKVAYSEGQIGWIPYVLERADQVWGDNRGWGGVAEKVLRPPSEYYFEHVYGCFFDGAAHGLNNIDAVGRDNVTFETDYPHSDSTWPHTKKVAEEIMKDLDQETVDKICAATRSAALAGPPGLKHAIDRIDRCEARLRLRGFERRRAAHVHGGRGATRRASRRTRHRCRFRRWQRRSDEGRRRRDDGRRR